MDNLQEIGARYILNKGELDSYKKLVDEDNKRLKEMMVSSTLEVGDTIITKSKEVRVKVDEDKLCAYLMKNAINVEGLIKTKHYVDTDVLESAIYNGAISEDIVKGMKECQTETEIVKLTLKKKRSE